MEIWAVVLFLIPLSAGFLVLRFSKFSEQYFTDLLSFGGAFLFAITLLHLLPEVFSQSLDVHQSGFWILLGFLVQVGFDIFFGSEHNTNKLLKISPISFLIAIFFHAFTEGGLLAFSQDTAHIGEEMHAHHHHHEGGILLLSFAILLHKIPTAMIVTSVFLVRYTKNGAFIGLLIMVSATPLGMFLHEYLAENHIISTNFGQALSALVAGSFLHVASVLFFHSVHEQTTQKIRQASFVGLGIAIAILGELLF